MIASGRRLANKVAIVTASTEGIGFAIAKRFAEHGAKVMISSRKEKNVAKALEDLKSHGTSVSGTVCHVGHDEDRKHLVKETIDKYGKLDILVSNAATNPTFGPIIDVTESTWGKIFDVNVKSAFLLAKECHPHLSSTKGSIVFISSIAGYSNMPGLGAYCVSKTALLGLSNVLASELAHDDIRVNCIAPGIIKTKFSSALWQSEEIENEMKKRIGMRRLGTSDEVSNAALFLCSDEASYITGETMVVAGGMQSRM